MSRRPRAFAPSLVVLSLVLIGAAWAALRARLPPPAASTNLPPVVATRGNIVPDLPHRVLVAYNAQSPESVDIARRYAAARRIPASNLVGLLCPDTDEIRRADYESTVLPYIRERAASDPEIAYIVLMRGVPFRFADWGNFGGFAVDSVLATCLMTLPPSDAPNAPLPGMMTKPRAGATSRQPVLRRERTHG